MKKTLCVILILLCLTTVCAGALAESENYSFTPRLTNALDHSASEWYATSSNRALLSLLLGIEALGNAEGIPSDFELMKVFLRSSYMGKDGVILAFYGTDGKYIFSIQYCPVLKTANYFFFEASLSDSLADLLLESTIKDVCSDGYKKNDNGEIVEWVEQLSEIFK